MARVDPPGRTVAAGVAGCHRLMAMTPMIGDAAELVVNEAAALSAAGCMFRSLGDPTPLAILPHLAVGEHKVVELTAHLGLAQSTVSAHLACLRDCGSVISRPEGRASVWLLAQVEDDEDET